MPKVYLTERERKEAKLSNYLIRSLRMNGITITDVAKELGTTRATMSRKIHKSDLNYYELWKVFKMLGTDEKTVLKLMGE